MPPSLYMKLEEISWKDNKNKEGDENGKIKLQCKERKENSSRHEKK